MAAASPFRKFCWNLCCGGCHCANLLLCTLALVQTSLILLNNLQREIPIPHFLARAAVAWSFQNAPVRATWDSAVFDLRGNFFFQGFELYQQGSREKVLSAETLGVDAAPLLFAFALFPPFESLHATGLQFYAPARHSASGVNDPVLQVPQIQVYQDNGDLVVEEFLLASAGLRLYLSGRGPLHALSPPSSGSSASSNPFQLLHVLQKIPDATALDCRILWSWNSRGAHSFQITALAQSIALPHLRLGQTLAKATLLADPAFDLTMDSLVLRSSLHPSSLHGLPPFITRSLSSNPVPFSISASGHPSPWKGFEVPSNIRAHFRSPLSRFPGAHSVRIFTHLSDPSPKLHWSLHSGKLFAAGSTCLFPEAPLRLPPSPQVAFRAYLSQPILRDLFPNLPQHRLLHNACAEFLRFNGSFSENSLSGAFVCDHLFVGQTPFSHIQARISLSPHRLLLDPVHVRPAPGESASASYFHHFPSSRFSLNASGSILPQALTPLLGNWWAQIFSQIEIPTPLPADVTVWGLWREQDSWQSVTEVEGRGGWYRGIQIPWLRVQVRSNEKWVYLEDLEARFREGRIEGKMAWQQGIREGQPRPVRIDFRSDSRWPIVQQASGLEQLGEIWVEGTPKVSAKGLIWMRPKGIPGAEAPPVDLDLSLESRGERFRIANLHLDALSFNGRVRDRELTIRGMNGRFAEGVFTADLRASDWDREGGGRRDLEVRLFDANYQKALKKLEVLMEDANRLEPLYREGNEGRLDANMSLQLRSGFAETRGRGQVTLRRGRIGEIHLLGGLSRFLSTMGLGFSTLELNAATVQWQLENGILEIPECAITGPVLNLDLYGQANLLTEQFHLRADAYFFGGLVGKLLTPLSDNFEFDITGPFQEPHWQLRLNPLRWFQNRMGSRPEEAFP